MELKFIRHATMIIKANGKKILIDPVFARVGDIDFIPYVENRRRNPLIQLKTPISELINVDAVVVTHTHVDHFDVRARSRLKKDIMLFCQECNESEIRKAGFTNVHPVQEFVEWEGIKINRVDGKHGEGEALGIMGFTSGFVFEDSTGFKIYVAGDSMLYDEVEKTIEKFKPNVIVVNSGSESLPIGRPVTMNEEDIRKLVEKSPVSAKIVAVHMDAWNNCLLTKQELKEFLESKRIEDRVIIPDENEELAF